MLNIFELLIFQQQTLNLPDIIDNNVSLWVHPSIVAVEELSIVNVNALKENRNVKLRERRDLLLVDYVRAFGRFGEWG